ncbi:phage major capsid protein [Paraburkholderia sp. BR10923]|uniref:phage major capsid family protein n=1 Tax=Paraburkholderia sp. BR10923 TaxID=3236992 RepID=UPI0034CFB2CF
MDYTFAQVARSLALAQGDIANAKLRAAASYGTRSRAYEYLTKAEAISTGSISGDGLPVAFGGFAGFVSAIRATSIIGRLEEALPASFQRTLPYTPLLAEGSTASAGWTAELQLKNVTGDTFVATRMVPKKCSGTIVITDEFGKQVGDAANAWITRNLSRAVTTKLNTTFASDEPASDASPGGIFQGITALPSSGDAADDLFALLDSFPGNLDTSAIICTPSVAARLAVDWSTVGVAGGFASGVVVVTSSDLSAGFMGIADLSGIELWMGPVEPSATGESIITIETDSGSQGLPLWQSNLLALRAEQFCAWQRLRDDAVRWIADASGVRKADAPKVKARAAA